MHTCIHKYEILLKRNSYNYIIILQPRVSKYWYCRLFAKVINYKNWICRDMSLMCLWQRSAALYGVIFADNNECIERTHALTKRLPTQNCNLPNGEWDSRRGINQRRLRSVYGEYTYAMKLTERKSHTVL